MKKTIVNFLPRWFLFLGVLLFPLAAHAFLPGDLYVSDSSSGTVYYFTPAGSKVIFGSGFSNPYGLAFDRFGDLYVAESGAGKVTKVPLHSASSTVVSGVGTPYGLAFNSKGELFVVDNFSGTIVKLSGPADSLSTRTVFASGLIDPNGIAFDKNGNLFVANSGSNSILKFTPMGARSTFTSGLNAPKDLAFDVAGNLFETDAGTGNIYKFTTAGAKSTFTSNLLGPFGLAFDRAGNLFEASFGFNTIYKITPARVKTTFASGLNSPTFAAFRPTTEKFANISTRGLVGTGEQVLIAGFILGGSGLTNNSVVIRAIGPSLTRAGITDALKDPTLELHNASGAIITSNNNWKDTQQAQIQATGLAPTDPQESAILINLPAGRYTAIVRGLSNTTGVGLVEVYNTR